MLELIKKALRISHNKLDNVIQNDIETCLLDLKRVGIVVVMQTDPVIVKLAELYTKWQEDYQGKGDKYQAAYEGMRDAISLCGDYNVRSTS